MLPLIIQHRQSILFWLMLNRKSIYDLSEKISGLPLRPCNFYLALFVRRGSEINLFLPINTLNSIKFGFAVIQKSTSKKSLSYL
jgi:hypothetical protein